MNVDARMQAPGTANALVERVDPTSVFVPRFAENPARGEGLVADPRQFLNILWRWRWLFFAALASAIGLATVLTFLATPRYMARATLEIDQPEARAMGAERDDRVVVRDPQFLTTQLGLLKSEALTDRVAMSLGLTGNPQFADPAGSRDDRVSQASAQIQGGLEVKPVDTSRLIEITFSDTDPIRAAKIVNSLVENFLSMNLERRFDATASARKFLENRIATVKAALEKSERQLVDYARSRGIVLVQSNTSDSETGAGAGTTSLDASSLVAMNESLSEAQNARIQAEQRYRQARGSSSTSEVLANPAVQSMVSRLSVLQTEYDQKLQTFKPDYPEVAALKAQIEGLERQIRGQSGNVSNSVRGDYLAAVARERALQARVNQLKGAVLDLRGRSVQYNILQREVDTNRTLYDGLLQRYKEIGVAGGIGTNSASIVNHAKVPKAPYSPNLILNIIFASLLGLAGALLLAFVLEYLDDTIKSPDDVQSKLRHNLLGAVPLLDKGEVFWDLLHIPGSKIAEAYATVRANIQFSTSQGAPKTILVTSSQAGEGKSSTSLAIAQNLARLGHTVLIIDADMRKPSFHASHGDASGLSSLLTQNAELQSSLLGTQHEGLFLLPSGPIPPNPAELLSSERMMSLLTEVEGMFDHVVVDAPPLLGLADAALLGSLCQATIFIAEANRTRRPAALNALERLRTGGAKIIGVILTKYKASAAHAYGYAYYAYGIDSKSNVGELPLITQRLK